MRVTYDAPVMVDIYTLIGILRCYSPIVFFRTTNAYQASNTL